MSTVAGTLILLGIIGAILAVFQAPTWLLAVIACSVFALPLIHFIITVAHNALTSDVKGVRP